MNKQQEQWEKEFDNEFFWLDTDSPGTVDKVIDFIESLLQKKKEEYEKDLERKDKHC